MNASKLNFKELFSWDKLTQFFCSYARTLFSSLYLLVFSLGALLLYADYYSVEYSNFDTGIFANSVYNFWSTSDPYSSILQKNILSDHFCPLILLFAPILFIDPSFLFLPLAKFLAFMACPLALFWFSRLLMPNSKLAYLTPAMWLIHRYLSKTLLFEFQPSSLALPFIILVFVFIEKEWKKASLLCLIFLLGFKEHLGLVWISAGAYLYLFKGSKKEGVTIACLGCFAGLAIYFTVIPFFSSTSSLTHIHRFGPFEEIYLKINLVFKGLLSVALLPFLVPKSILLVLPAFGLSFVANQSSMLGYSFHYQDIALTMLFIASTLGIKRFSEMNFKGRPKYLKKYLGVALVILFIAQNNVYLLSSLVKRWPTAKEISLVKRLESFSTSIEPGTEIWTQDALGPYFYNFKNLRTIDERFEISQVNPGGLIVTSEHASAWPLSFEQKNRLLSQLEKSFLVSSSEDPVKFWSRR